MADLTRNSTLPDSAEKTDFYNLVDTATVANVGGKTSSQIATAVDKSHDQNTDIKIKDTDGDTQIQVEETADEDKIRFDTAATERMVLDSNGLQIAVASPATPQANTIVKDNIVKAWINFDGAAATISIRDSFNVTSITDNGTGDYTITWDTDFAATDYAVAGLAGYLNGSNDRVIDIKVIGTGALTVQVWSLSAGAVTDAEVVCLIAIGNQ